MQLFDQATKNTVLSFIGELGTCSVRLRSDGLSNANDFMLDHFIRDVSNKRTNEYGGSIKNMDQSPLKKLNSGSGKIQFSNPTWR